MRAASRRARGLNLPGVYPRLAILAALAMGLLADGTSAVGAQAGGYRLLARWPDPNAQSPPGTLINPWGIEVAPDGTVAVADTGNRRLQFFQADGQLLGTWGEHPAGLPLNQPRDVAITQERVYITDGTGLVVVTDRNGVLLATWTGLEEPWGIAVGPGGKVYVVDRRRQQIAVFDPSGQQVATVGQPGSRRGQFRNPQGIDIASNGEVYVADTGNNRIQILNAAGRARDVFTPRQVASSNLSAPQDVTVDGRGNIFVATAEAVAWFHRDLTRQIRFEHRYATPSAAALAVDPLYGLYVVRSSDSRRVAEVVRYGYLAKQGPTGRFGSYGGHMTRLEDVRRLAPAPGGEVAVLTGSAAVRYRRDGQLVGAEPGVGGLEDLVYLPQGGFVAATVSFIARYTAAGSLVWRWPEQSGTPGQPQTPGGLFHWIAALAYDPSVQVVYAADVGMGRLVRLRAADGSLVGEIQLAPDNSLVAYRDLAINDRGQLVAVNQSARQVEFRSRNWQLERLLVPAGVPVSVALARDATFVLTRDGFVWRYGADLALETVWNGGAGGLALDVVALGEQVLTLERNTNQVLVWAYDAAAQPEPPPRPPESVRCRVESDKTASPPVSLLGEEVRVRLTIGGSCPDVAPQADIMLIIDRSGSMGEAGKLQAAKAAALAFLDAVDFGQSRVGIVRFNHTAELVQPLTDDTVALRKAIQSLTADGSTNIAWPLQIATAELAGPRRRPTALGVIVLLTDGIHNTGPLGPAVPALEAKLDGNRLFTIGLGPDVNTALLERIASAPQDYYFAPQAADLAAIYADIARRIQAEVLFRTLIVTDLVPEQMAYRGMVRGPEPEVTSNQLTWTLVEVSFAGVELVYRLLPRQPGDQPTNVLATANYVDGFGHPGRAVLPLPRVLVLSPATPTASPTATPSPPPPAIYLPLLANRLCRPALKHADVVLVTDTSTSMRQLTRSGRTKLEAAVAAAEAFVDLLQLPADQVGLVVFNRRARLVAPLGTTAAELHARLAGQEVAEGTRIDLGLLAGTAELSGPRHWEVNRAVLILLTDGLPNGTTPEAVIAAALAARRRGVEVFAIGLGQNVDPLLLAQVASDASYLYLAPDGEDLERIYRLIAAAIPCRP